MNKQQLIAVLRSGKVGQHNIGAVWTPVEVLELWEANVSRRDQRIFRLFAWQGTVCIMPRGAIEETRREMAKLVAAWALFAFVLFLGASILEADEPRAETTTEARHECVRELGEDCKL